MSGLSTVASAKLWSSRARQRLKQSEYGSMERHDQLVQSPPCIQKGVTSAPVLVEVHFCWIFLTEISSQMQTFFADFVMVTEWDSDDAEWSPALEIKNVKDETTVFDSGAHSVSDGRIRRVVRLRAVLYEHLELEDFPLDIQELTIVVHSAHPASEVQLIHHRTKESQTDYFLLTEWQMLPFLTTESITAPTQSRGEEDEYCELHHRAYVQRNSGYYLTHVTSIIFLICTSALCGFAVPLSDIADRLQVQITLLLTAVAFKFVISENLPKVSYATTLDKYVMTCFAFLYFVIASHILVTMSDDPEWLDRACLFVGIGVWLLLHLILGVTVLWHHRRRATRTPRELIADEMEERAAATGIICNPEDVHISMLTPMHSRHKTLKDNVSHPRRYTTVEKRRETKSK